ncbi:MAG TPA: hypothetical protein DEP42_03310 [Ruminococcaceae bacterium]|nr:hypothetical protein [Oscillospiraceae bacterium]
MNGIDLAQSREVLKIEDLFTELTEITTSRLFYILCWPAMSPVTFRCDKAATRSSFFLNKKLARGINTGVLPMLRK